MAPVHVPAMVTETLQYLDPQPGKTILDMTLGSGGHSLCLLERGARVIGIDRDPDAIERAREALLRYADRVVLVHARLSDAREVLERLGVVQGVSAAFRLLGGARFTSVWPLRAMRKFTLP